MGEDQVMAVWMAHRQGPRGDGTWGCACGWVQDKPHAEHVADMVAATLTAPTAEAS